MPNLFQIIFKCRQMLNFKMNTIEDLHLVNLLDGGAGPGTSRSSSTSTGHTTARHSSHVRHATTGSSSGRLVELGNDGVADGLNLLLLLLELLNLGQLVGVQPLDGVITLVGDQVRHAT